MKVDDERAAGLLGVIRRRFLLSRRPTAGYYAIMKSQFASRDPEVMGGAAVFNGTRIPLQTLLAYLEAAESIDAFLEDFRQCLESG